MAWEAACRFSNAEVAELSTTDNKPSPCGVWHLHRLLPWMCNMILFIEWLIADGYFIPGKLYFMRGSKNIRLLFDCSTPCHVSISPEVQNVLLRLLYKVWKFLDDTMDVRRYYVSLFLSLKHAQCPSTLKQVNQIQQINRLHGWDEQYACCTMLKCVLAKQSHT